VYSGVVDSLVPWQYLHRFCFKPTPQTITDLRDINQLKHFGLFFYSVYYNSKDKPSLMLFYDGFDSWTQVRNSSLTCEERRQYLSAEIHLWLLDGKIVSQSKNDVSNYDIKVEGYVIFRASYPTYFFISAANCDKSCNSAFCQGSLQLQYEFLLSNGLDRSDKQFSSDEQGILEILLVFLLIYILLSIFAFGVGYALAKLQKLHHTVVLLIYSIILQLIGVVCRLINYVQYSSNGQGVPAFEVAGCILQVVSNVLVVLLLILLAKGWTIYRKEISATGRMKIAVYFTFFLLFSCVVQWLAVYQFDPSMVVSPYESTPGFILISLWFLMWAWFLHASYTTFKNSKQKRGFYKKFCTLFGLWFIIIPLLYIASIKVDNSKRARFAVAWELIYMSVAHVALLILYNPVTRCNKTFPFHANTSDMLGIPRLETRVELQGDGRLLGNSNDEEQGQNESIPKDLPHVVENAVAALNSAESAFEETALLLGSHDPYYIARDSGNRLFQGLSGCRRVAGDLREALQDINDEDRDTDLPGEDEVRLRSLKDKCANFKAGTVNYTDVGRRR